MKRSPVQQSSSIIPFHRRSQLKTLIQLMPFISKKIRRASAVILLSAVAPLWLVTETIAPQIVQAYTARADLAIDRLPEDNYESLLRRAEAAARAAAQRSFDQDILVTEVSIIVSVQSHGAIAPVLLLDVSRPQWRTRPDPQIWAKYYRASRSLLYFGDNFTTTASDKPEKTTTNKTPTATSKPTTPSGDTGTLNVPPKVAPPTPAVQSIKK